MTRHTFLCSAIALIVTAGAAGSAAADPAPEATVRRMLKAVETRSYEEFIADADAALRAALTKEQFEGVAGVYGPRLRAGYKLTYLTRLRQAGHDVHLWKLEFKDGKDDVVARMALKGGKVGGIFFQ